MEKLTQINLLQKKIDQEIIRLLNSPDFNLEKEQERLRIYEKLVKEILENHV